MYKVKDLERGKEMKGDVCWGDRKLRINLC